MVSIKKLFGLSVLASVMAACSTTPINTTEDGTGPKIETIGASGAGAAGAAGTDNRAVPTIEPLATSNDQTPSFESELLTKRSIYFDLDEYDVKPEHRDVIQAHAKFLAANPARQVVIQGHTDERGGAEYNLALGQRRADSVRQIMTALGVASRQIETISFGKEKPKAYGSNEQAWAENRRADIVYK